MRIAILFLVLAVNLTQPALASGGKGGQTEPKDKEAAGNRATHKQAGPAPGHGRTRSGALMVPPPPPVVPVIGQLSSGLPVELLSADELKKRREEVLGQISSARSLVEQQGKVADERRQRSNLFASLYTEGVVSRRELEAAQTDDTKADEDLNEAKRKLGDLEKDISRIDAQLKKLASSSHGKGIVKSTSDLKSARN